MRTEVDVALADPDASVDELRAMGEAVRETVDRCERLIESLLLLARSEAALRREEPVDLAALAGDCVTDLRARAQEAQVAISVDLEPAVVRGDPALLERLIANLIDNGIRHNEPGGSAAVRTRQTGATVRDRRLQRRPADRSRGRRDADRAVPAARARPPAGSASACRSCARSPRLTAVTAVLSAPADGGLEVHVSLPARRGIRGATLRKR